MKKVALTAAMLAFAAPAFAGNVEVFVAPPAEPEPPVVEEMGSNAAWLVPVVAIVAIAAAVAATN